MVTFFVLGSIYMWHSVGEGPILSFLKMEMLRKIGEMVKKLKKMIFLIWCVRPPETSLCWQNTEKVTPRLNLRSIIHGNRGFIWSISLQLCTVSVKRCKNKFPTLRRCGILVKASPDRCV